VADTAPPVLASDVPDAIEAWHPVARTYDWPVQMTSKNALMTRAVHDRTERSGRPARPVH